MFLRTNKKVVLNECCSLEHVLDVDFHALDGADGGLGVKLRDISGVLSAEELVDELSVSLVLDVEFSSLEVVELVVLEHLSRDTLASEEPDSLNLEELAVGLLGDNGVGESVGSELILASLDEHVEEVLGLVILNVVLVVIALVLDKVDGIAFGIVILPESLHTFGGFLVSKVDEVRLELGEDELGGREEIKGVLS